MSKELKNKIIEDFKSMGIESDLITEEHEDFQTLAILKAIDEYLDPLHLLDIRLTQEKINIIRYGLELNLNVSLYANPIYSAAQMEVLANALIRDISIFEITDHLYDKGIPMHIEGMKRIISKKQKEMEQLEYNMRNPLTEIADALNRNYSMIEKMARQLELLNYSLKEKK